MNFHWKDIEDAFQSFISLMEDKYRSWTYESPLFIDRTRVEFLQKSQNIMLRLMQYIAENYASLEDYMPHDAAVKSFLKELQEVPFQKGTFRTDFVINEQNEIRLIEVTCRYPLNSYFRSVAANTMNEAQQYETLYGLKPISYTKPLLEKFLGWMGDAGRVIIIQGEDCRDNESMYQPYILSEAGIELHTCTYEEWLRHGADWVNGAAIIAELTFEEWLGMPIELVRLMMKRPLLNDPRIVFIVHDKSFFGLVNFKEITDKALSPEESSFIQKAFAETFFAGHHPEMWENAGQNPKDWMLKPRRLGRSVDIIAGSLSTPEEWQAALTAAQGKGNMILQKWHLSKKISGTVQRVDYEDYFAGTLLYWGDEFFGPGLFRASCYPISNVKDNRMVTSFIDLKADPKKYPDLQWI
ncbi:hypothetical protein [Flagellimonas marinaquae]